jgi:Anti-sigma factor NepR
MTDDDEPPDNVIPFRNMIPYAIGLDLRRYYQALVAEPLPDKILELYQEFEKLAQEPEQSEEPKKAKDTAQKV